MQLSLVKRSKVECVTRESEQWYQDKWHTGAESRKQSIGLSYLFFFLLTHVGEVFLSERKKISGWICIFVWFT